MTLQSSPPITLNQIYNEASANGYTGARSVNALLAWSGWTNLPPSSDSVMDFIGAKHINTVETTLTATTIRVVNNSSVNLLGVKTYIGSHGLVATILPSQDLDVPSNTMSSFTSWGSFTSGQDPDLGVEYWIGAVGNTVAEMSNVKARIANSVSNEDGLPFPNISLIKNGIHYSYPDGSNAWFDVGPVPPVCVLDFSFDVIFEDIV